MNTSKSLNDNGRISHMQRAETALTNQADELCVVCEKLPATGEYEGHQTCGRIKCDLTVQEFLDYNAEVGDR